MRMSRLKSEVFGGNGSPLLRRNIAVRRRKPSAGKGVAAECRTGGAD